jgi:DNA mismatch repair protein MutL
VPPEAWRTLYERREEASGGEPALESRSQPPTAAAQRPPGPRPAIQVHRTYLVTETEGGMLIIDQHALHERIIYERLKARIVNGPLESQRLLLPETVTVTTKQQALLHEYEEQLRQLGIEAEPFGADAIAIHAFPPILKNVDAVAFLRDLLDKLATARGRPNTEAVIHELLDMMACKAAVKAGDPLTFEEIDALIAQKELVEKSSNCPHGRPTTLRLSIHDLEKQFKRR